MTDTLKIIFSVISAIGVVSGVLAWWVSKLLADKKDTITHALEIDFMKKQLVEIKDDIKDIKRAFDDYKN